MSFLREKVAESRMRRRGGEVWAIADLLFIHIIYIMQFWMVPVCSASWQETETRNVAT